MSTRSHSAECTLIYGAAPMVDEAGLVQRLAAGLRTRVATSTTVETEHQPGIYIHLGLGPIEVLVSLCPMRLPAQHFAGARRPPHPVRNNGYVQSLLEFHETCITVLVTARRQCGAPVPPSRVDTLCETVAQQLACATAPDLIFLNSSDVLYAREEFAIIDLAARPAIATTHAGIPNDGSLRNAHIRAQPSVPKVAEDWFIHGRRGSQRRTQHTRHNQSAAEPEILSEELCDTLAGSAAIYALNATLILFSFPIGYALLIYNIMSGGNFVLTARALSLTGTAMAASSTGLTSMAMRFL